MSPSQTMNQESSPSTLEVDKTTPSKGAFSRPELFTLKGLYTSTKSVYATYVPTAAAQLISGVSQSLFKAATPFVVKVLPSNSSPEWKSLENGNVADIDSLLYSYFVAGDATIDTFINSSTDRVFQKYTTYKELLLTKTASWKAAVVEKLQGVKPKYESAKSQATEKFETTKIQVNEQMESAKTHVVEKFETAKTQVTDQVTAKYESAKSVVQSKMEDERIAAVMEQAKPYIELVKENVEPAKTVLKEMATNAHAEVTEKGYVEFAKESAETIRDQGLDVIETCKAKGTVEGVKDISNQVLSNVVSKLDDVKNRTITVEGVQASSQVAKNDEMKSSTSVEGSQKPTNQIKHVKSKSHHHQMS